MRKNKDKEKGLESTKKTGNPRKGKGVIKTF